MMIISNKTNSLNSSKSDKQTSVLSTTKHKFSTKYHKTVGFFFGVSN